jgi:hypothetical protein
MNTIRFVDLLYLLLIFFCSCQNVSTNQTQNQGSSGLIDRLQGSWITNPIEIDGRKRVLTFEFKDSLWSYMYPAGEYKHFDILDSTIYLVEEGSKPFHPDLVLGFHLDTLGADTLVLKPNDKALKLNFYKFVNRDSFRNIHLSKLTHQYNYPIERIGFFSSPCYGSCPTMYLECNKNGEFYFIGRYYTDTTGYFEGKLSQKQRWNIAQSINAIQLDSLKSEYSVNWTDDQTCEIIIQTKTKTYYSQVYGSEHEPVALRLLFHELMELYRFVDLAADSTIIDQLHFYSEEGKYSPVKPPPPILSIDEEMDNLKNELKSI